MNIIWMHFGLIFFVCRTSGHWICCLFWLLDCRKPLCTLMYVRYTVCWCLCLFLSLFCVYVCRNKIKKNFEYCESLDISVRLGCRPSTQISIEMRNKNRLWWLNHNVAKCFTKAIIAFIPFHIPQLYSLLYISAAEKAAFCLCCCIDQQIFCMFLCWIMDNKAIIIEPAESFSSLVALIIWLQSPSLGSKRHFRWH